MPINQPKQGSYVPNPVGPLKLVTRSATRSRLYAAGTFFRSKDLGEQNNLIKIGIIEDLSSDTPEGICVVHHTQLNPTEQISVLGMEMPNLQIYKLDIDWNQELKIWHNGTEWRGELIGIRWQIAPGVLPPSADSGVVQDGIFNAPNISFNLTGIANWPTTATVYLRPRTRRYTLVRHSITDTETMSSTIGWSPEALRASLNSDLTGFVYMPARASAENLPVSDGEDKQDIGIDANFITTLVMSNMQGGSGLPTAPVGLNTGPARVLVHLNYSEKPDGSMGELNQVFEWVGTAANIGSWQQYS